MVRFQLTSQRSWKAEWHQVSYFLNTHCEMFFPGGYFGSLGFLPATSPSKFLPHLLMIALLNREIEQEVVWLSRYKAT